MFLSIAENITLADLSSVMRNGAIDYGRERQLASDWIKSPAHQGTGSGHRLPQTLRRQPAEGGTGAMDDGRVAHLDPRSPDARARCRREGGGLRTGARTCPSQGVAILLISDTLEETIGLSHRVLVMRDGAVTAHFDAAPGSKPDQVDLVRAMV